MARAQTTALGTKMSTQWLWWAPLVAALAHIAEQCRLSRAAAGSQGRRSRRFPGAADAVLVALCLRTGLAGTTSSGGLAGIPPEYNATFWLLLAGAMFSNAVLQVEETLRTRRVSPGLYTALLMYVPLAVYGFRHFFTAGLAPVSIAILAALAWASFHAWPFLFEPRTGR